MKFLKAAFRITIFQIAFIIILGLSKYLLIKYKVIDFIMTPFIWICVIAAVIFAFSFGILNLMEENDQSTVKPHKYLAKIQKSTLLTTIITGGFVIPRIIFYIFFLYIIAPTSIFFCIALYAGIVLGNCLKYFKMDESI